MFCLPKVTCEIRLPRFHIWHSVQRKWKMPNKVIEKKGFCFTSTKKCKFPTNSRWLYFIKLRKTDSDSFCVVNLVNNDFAELFFGVTTFYCSSLGILSNARTGALMVAGMLPINVWEARFCTILVPNLSFLFNCCCLFIYIPRVPLLFCSQSLLIKRAYYRNTDEQYRV